MFTEKDKKKYAAKELDVLSGVIDYAERMIFEEGNKVEYLPLRRHAYGKTVVVDSEKKGLLEFRLSSTSVTYPNLASGYATPQSPVGRLCSVVRPGYEGRSPAWGDYRVIETRLFDRFDGPEFENNVRNFLRMHVDGDAGSADVTNLKRFVGGKLKKAGELEPALTTAADELVETPVPQPQVPTPVTVTELAVVDDDELSEQVVLDESEDVDDTPVEETTEYYGLSEIFYLNRTQEQDKVVSRSPLGPMYVEGVAGSGKTSAALGRTKMLCDFNARNVTEEHEFRNIVGDADLDYWSGKFAGQFSQEGSVGFVRTGELIQYLKETCRRLDLPNLPVLEYRELQHKLKSHRRIDRSGKPGWRWMGLPEPRGTQVDTTMQWLYAADRAVGASYADLLLRALPGARSIGERFVEADQQKATRIATVALDFLKGKLEDIAASLRRDPATSKFVLEELANRVYQAIRITRQTVLGRSVLWFIHQGHAEFAQNERDMAAWLIAKNVPLYLRSGARLVFVSAEGLQDRTLTLISEATEALPWNDETAKLLADGRLLVRTADGRTFTAKRSDEDDLYLRLLPEAIDRPFLEAKGKLHRLPLSRGLGREKLTLKAPLEESNEELEDDGDLPEAEGASEGDTKADRRQQTLAALLNRVLTSALLQPLAYPADAYLTSLEVSGSSYPDTKVAEIIREQMLAKRLADEDVDLLLCISHLIGRGFQQRPRALMQTPYYQSVFIDEVQDFTEQQVFLMAEQARPEYRAVTAVGDIAQKLHHGSRIDIPACFPFEPKLPYVKLTENIRQLGVPGLALFSTCFRELLQEGRPNVSPTEELSARLRTVGVLSQGPEVVRCHSRSNMDEEILRVLKDGAKGTAAVILPTGVEAVELHQRLRPVLASYHVDAEFSEKVDLSRRHVRHFMSVLNAKGLEFDLVILPNLESYDLDNQEHLNRLYVGVTRAKARLVMLAGSELHPRLEEALMAFEQIKTMHLPGSSAAINS